MSLAALDVMKSKNFCADSVRAVTALVTKTKGRCTEYVPALIVSSDGSTPFTDTTLTVDLMEATDAYQMAAGFWETVVIMSPVDVSS